MVHRYWITTNLGDRRSLGFFLTPSRTTSVNLAIMSRKRLMAEHREIVGDSTIAKAIRTVQPSISDTTFRCELDSSFPGTSLVTENSFGNDTLVYPWSLP